MTPSNGNEDAFTTSRLVKSRAQTLPAAPVGARLRTLLTFSLAVAVALAVHLFVSKKEPALETRSYTVFLSAVLAKGRQAGLLRRHEHLRQRHFYHIGNGRSYIEPDTSLLGRL